MTGERCGKAVGIYSNGEEEATSLGERTGFVAQGVRDEQEEEGANSRDYERDSGVARGGWMDGRGGVCQFDLLFSGDTRPAKLPTTTVVLFCFLEFV